jgi:excisionase family DNA binding protein
MIMDTPITAEQLVESGLDRVREAARFLGISVSQAYALMERGELPFVKFGKSRRIPRRALIEFAKRHLMNG